MSNELESDRAMVSSMVMNLESFGVDGVGYDETVTVALCQPSEVLVQAPGPPQLQVSS